MLSSWAPGEAAVGWWGAHLSPSMLDTHVLGVSEEVTGLSNWSCAQSSNARIFCVLGTEENTEAKATPQGILSPYERM